MSEPVLYGAGPTVYPTSGVTLVLEDGKITRLVHDLTDEQDVLLESEIVRLSHQELIFLFALLEFLSGDPLHTHRHVTECLDRPSTTGGLQLPMLRLSGRGTVRFAGTVPVRLPSDTVARPSRLAVWLHLANDARRTTSAVDAIRNYYMIWEDICGVPSAGSTEEEIKHVRDFVSHGNKLKNKRLLVFLQQELGTYVTQYDPHNERHKRFVEARRATIRDMVSVKLREYL